MVEPMTEAEARERLAARAKERQRVAVSGWYIPDAMATSAVDAVLATADALAVLLDPETMLRAWEKAGRVAAFEWRTPTGLHITHTYWRIVPDEEGARDG